MDLGVTSLTFGDCYFGPSCRKLGQHMAEIIKMFFKGLASHENALWIKVLNSAGELAYLNRQQFQVYWRLPKEILMLMLC